MAKRGRKKYIQIALFLAIILAIFSVIYFDVIKESVISGFQIATFDVLITIDSDPPDIFIIHPTNTTYDYSSIDLNFTVIDNGAVDKIWYNLDNGINTTITENTTVTVSASGSHTIYLFANDTARNLNSSQVTFTRTSTVQVAPGGGGGGGSSGGGSVGGVISNSFTLDRSEIKVELKKGETKSLELGITNNLAENLKIDIGTGILKRFVSITEDSFILKPKETKKINIDVIAPENVDSDLYIGNIIVKDIYQQKSILTAIEIEDRKPLFDVKVDIPAKFKELLAGEELLATITLFSVERVGLVDVNIEYIIKDSEGNPVLLEKEIIAVDVQASFVKSLKLPKDMKLGEHILYVRVDYEGTVGSASAFFKIIELQTPKKFGINVNYIIIITLILIATLILARFILKAFKIKNKKNIRSKKRKKTTK